MSSERSASASLARRSALQADEQRGVEEVAAQLTEEHPDTNAPGNATTQSSHPVLEPPTPQPRAAAAPEPRQPPLEGQETLAEPSPSPKPRGLL